MSDRLMHTPLHDEHHALGANMVEHKGWELPLQYAGLIDEHRAVRASAGVFDLSYLPELRVFGFGAFDFLQSVLTNDLSRISEVGECQHSLMCDEDGGIVDRLTVCHTGELEYLLIGSIENRASIFEWLRSHAPAGVELVHETQADRVPSAGLVELVDESERTALVAVSGPDAIGVVRELAGGDWQPPEPMTIAEARLDRVPVLAIRATETGEDGVALLTHSSLAAALWRILLSFAEVTPIGIGAAETLRLDMGYPEYGHEIDRTVDPFAAGLASLVVLGKGEFVGCGSLSAVRDAGSATCLTGLALQDGVPRAGERVLHGGREVGKVASGAFSPTLGRAIATAFLPCSLSADGTELEVETREGTMSAVVENPPFVKKTSVSA